MIYYDTPSERSNTSIATIEYDPIEDEYYLVSPSLKAAGFEPGDILNWKDQGDGSFLLTKKN